MATTESRRLVKPHQLPGGDGSVAFNYNDLQRQADDYLAKVRAEAQALWKSAQEEAEQVRQQTHKQAFADGYKAGLSDADREIKKRSEAQAAEMAEKRLETAVPALANAIELLHIEREQYLSRWEKTAIILSLEIARRVVRHDVRANPEVVTHLAREALDLAIGEPEIHLHIHPDDMPLVASTLSRSATTPASKGPHLVPDPAIERGGCRLESRHGVIDAQIETQIDRIGKELLDGL